MISLVSVKSLPFFQVGIHSISSYELSGFISTQNVSEWKQRKAGVGRVMITPQITVTVSIPSQYLDITLPPLLS